MPVDESIDRARTILAGWTPRKLDNLMGAWTMPTTLTAADRLVALDELLDSGIARVIGQPGTTLRGPMPGALPTLVVMVTPWEGWAARTERISRAVEYRDPRGLRVSPRAGVLWIDMDRERFTIILDRGVDLALAEAVRQWAILQRGRIDRQAQLTRL